MSFGLNTAFTGNVQAFLQAHALTTAMMSFQLPPVGPTRYDLLRSDVDNDPSVTLFHAHGGPPISENLIRAYWLPQGGYIDVPRAAPAASYIFTPELSGCKIYVDELPNTDLRVFHIQCPHEAAEYAANLRGVRQTQIDSRDYGGVPSVDGVANANRIPTIRATVLLEHNGVQWVIWLQGLTGIGPGMMGGRMVRPPGPPQGVGGVESKLVP